MGVLCIVSAEKASGKTAICAGLAINLANSGKSVGYQKYPLKEATDGDVSFMQQVLKEPDINKLEGKDVTLVEATLGPTVGDSSSQGAYHLAAEMKARVLAVETYADRPSDYTELYKGFGRNLLGVIINKVPEKILGNVKKSASGQLGKAGMQLLAVIPESRTLLAITIGELAEITRGEILNNTDKSEELVENYMLGAMVVDSGLDYFGRRGDKAAIIRQDRPDMQLAALETPTKCLILSEKSEPPQYNVLQKARNKGIPIIAAGMPAEDIVNRIEESILGSRLRQGKKLPRLAEAIKQNLDMDVIIG